MIVTGLQCRVYAAYPFFRYDKLWPRPTQMLLRYVFLEDNTFMCKSAYVDCFVSHYDTCIPI